MSSKKTAGLPNIDKITRLRARAQTLALEFPLTHTPAQVWPYVAQLDMLNLKAGASTAAYEFIPNERGESTPAGMTQKSGISLGYVEIPYEWFPPYRFTVEVFYHKGPFLYIKLVIGLLETLRGSEVVVRAHYVGANILTPAKFIIGKMIKDFVRAMIEIDRQIVAGDPMAVTPYLDASAETQSKAAALARKWQPLMPGSSIADKLAHFILASPDKCVSRMRPLEIAKQLALPETDVLRFCLLATQAGFLDLSWDLLCPSCRGGKLRVKHLAEFESATHCESCNIDYTAQFDTNVEVTFRPTERVRAAEDLQYCFNAPSNTPHINVQFNVMPNESRAVDLELEPGAYRLRSLAMEGQYMFTVAADSVNRDCDLDLGTEFAGLHATLAPKFKLTLSNLEACWKTCKIERLAYRENAVTAADVASLQDFREMFSSEVLHPNIQIGVSNIVIFFSDLKDSTALYEEHGDAPAFSLVQQHFELMTEIIRKRNGAVVKTIGDAIMATFTKPGNAAGACLEILRDFDAWNRTHPPEQQIVVKLGLHQGPCIALNLNDRLDYFGSTVNKAARVQGLSQGNDIVMPEKMLHQPEIQSALAEWQNEVVVTSFKSELKGISGKQALSCIRYLVPTRLA